MIVCLFCHMFNSLIYMRSHVCPSLCASVHRAVCPPVSQSRINFNIGHCSEAFESNHSVSEMIAVHCPLRFDTSDSDFDFG